MHGPDAGIDTERQGSLHGTDLGRTLITFNEEANIEGALESVSWADEIVVVDSGSTDATLEICRRFTDQIFHRDWTGYVDQKNFAVEKAASRLDLFPGRRRAGEPGAHGGNPEAARSRIHGSRIPNPARGLFHGTLDPPRRLVSRITSCACSTAGSGRWQGGRVHESVQTQGEPGLLEGEIHHYTYRSLSDYLRRLETYSTLAARIIGSGAKVSTACKPAR